MSNKIMFFPVGNGDMTLVKLGEEFTLLIDCNIKQNGGEDAPNTEEDLYAELPKDDSGRPYVDAFLITHPDQDHCLGAKKYLHLGKPEDYDDDPDEDEREKVFVHELWSSPMTFRRSKKQHEDNDETLCEDAEAIWAEARRRVTAYQDAGASSNEDMDEGERILILGDDEPDDEGKDRKEGLEGIRINLDEAIEKPGGFLANVRGPLDISDDDDENSVLAKNDSSVILQIEVSVDGSNEPNILLLGGDASSGIWSRLAERHKDEMSALKYELLLTPHHCSKSVLFSEDGELDEDAREALSQAEGGAKVISSSRDDWNNKDKLPPHTVAKDEYVDIIGDENSFYCTGESNKPLVFLLTKNAGPSEPPKKSTIEDAAKASIFIVPSKERGHG